MKKKATSSVKPRLTSHLHSCSADFENALWAEGYRRIAGVDEVGRGAWAGPVVTAAVVFAPGRFPKGLNDSKQLTPREREVLFDLIIADALEYSFGERDAATVDQVNVLEATRLAMGDAIGNLPSAPDYLLIDALTLPQITVPQRGIIHGDTLSVSIAAASILAKVSRDRMMVTLDTIYPGYDFGRHKGYGTRHHREALASLGPSPVHRLTYRGVLPTPEIAGKTSPTTTFHERKTAR